MGLWKIWLIGLVITIFTSVLVHKKSKINRIFIDILVIVSIILVGGIAEGWAISLGINANVDKNSEIILLGILVSLAACIMIWIVGAPILGIFKKKQFRPFEIASFILAFIIASLSWSQLFINYNNNIKDINETIVVNEQESKLLYFCNIPVQQVSGSISGDISGSMLWIDGEISGSISTLEELSYWYVNEDGDGEYNSAPANSSKIRFIEENENPYIEVITYRKQTKTVNYNNGEENAITESEWKEYIFYLPQAIMQYPIE